MKKSMVYLPKNKQEDLNLLSDMALKRLPQMENITLYGSYAREKKVITSSI